MECGGGGGWGSRGWSVVVVGVGGVGGGVWWWWSVVVVGVGGVGVEEEGGEVQKNKIRLCQWG